MHLRVRTFLVCEGCDSDYGGPNAGEYDHRELRGTIAEHLADQAMLDGWVRVIWGDQDVLLCSPKCVSSWLESREGRQG